MIDFGRAIVLGLLLTVSGGVALTRDIPTVTYPSEDELELALDAGEISYDDFLILRELITVGLDSTNIYLLQQISEPGLNLLESVPEYPTTSNAAPRKGVGGYVRHSYSKCFEDEGDVRYQTGIRCDLGEQVRVETKVRREFSGRERVLYRSMTLDGDGVIKKVIAGNFSGRYGLGAAFGYRGKMLDYSPDIDAESALFPDYGGHNGVKVDVASGRWTANGAVSIHRDSTHRLTTTAANLQHGFGRLTAGLILLNNDLRNRISGSSHREQLMSIWSEYKSASFNQAVEFVGQYASHGALGALVTEGQYQSERLRVNLYGWWYASKFNDLSAGSRTGTSSRRMSLDDLEFDFYSRRSGQRGGRVKSAVDLAKDWEFATDIQSSRLNVDSVDVQWSAKLTRKRLGSTDVSLDYYQRIKRCVNDDPSSLDKHRIQINAEYRRANILARQSIGYTNETELPARFSILSRLRIRIPSYGAVEFWSNVSQGLVSSGQIDTWYGFVRNQFVISTNLSADVKLGRYYRRSSWPHTQMVGTFSLEYAL